MPTPESTQSNATKISHDTKQAVGGFFVIAAIVVLALGIFFQNWAMIVSPWAFWFGISIHNWIEGNGSRHNA